LVKIIIPGCAMGMIAVSYSVVRPFFQQELLDFKMIHRMFSSLMSRPMWAWFNGSAMQNLQDLFSGEEDENHDRNGDLRTLLLESLQHTESAKPVLDNMRENLDKMQLEEDVERYRDRVLGTRSSVEAEWGATMKHLDLLIESRGLRLPPAKHALPVKHIAEGRKHKISRRVLEPIKEDQQEKGEKKRKKKEKKEKREGGEARRGSTGAVQI